MRPAIATSLIPANEYNDFEDETLTAISSANSEFQLSFQSARESVEEFKSPKVVDISSWHDSSSTTLCFKTSDGINKKKSEFPELEFNYIGIESTNWSTK